MGAQPQWQQCEPPHNAMNDAACLRHRSHHAGAKRDINQTINYMEASKEKRRGKGEVTMEPSSTPVSQNYNGVASNVNLPRSG